MLQEDIIVLLIYTFFKDGKCNYKNAFEEEWRGEEKTQMECIRLALQIQEFIALYTKQKKSTHEYQIYFPSIN